MASKHSLRVSHLGVLIVVLHGAFAHRLHEQSVSEAGRGTVVNEELPILDVDKVWHSSAKPLAKVSSGTVAAGVKAAFSSQDVSASSEDITHDGCVESNAKMLAAACPDFNQEKDCELCDMSLNTYSTSPTFEEHRDRNDKNICAKGALIPTVEVGYDYGTGNMFGSTFYVDEETCQCWRRLPVVQSVFHKPWKNMKIVKLHKDCSSSEVEVPLQDENSCGVASTTHQNKGSFNFFDPGQDKIKHGWADVYPCHWGPASEESKICK